MANPRVRGLIWWSNWAKKDWAIAAVGFTIIIFALTLIFDSPSKNPFFDSTTTTDLVDLTLSHIAKDRSACNDNNNPISTISFLYNFENHIRTYIICYYIYVAVCLDGSLPGYHFQKGFGSGSNNWLLHIEGGGWCNNIASCSFRKTTALGSSNYMDRQVRFSGILSRDASQNPDFHSWNKVKIRYCDGASFAGHPESEFRNGTKLFFRGQLIWEALMDELLSVGMSNAKQALLSGCSAGGLATLIHCNYFREILPKDATVKCLADAGFFLDEKDVTGYSTIQSFYHDVVNLQGVAKSLHKDCVTRMEPSKCFFPQEIIKSIKTPIFLVNPAYDFWQIQNILVPGASNLHGNWRRCRLNIQYCNSSLLKILQGFRNSLLKALSEFQQDKEGGMFINSCFIHCQTWMAGTWHSFNSPRVNNKTIAESVGDWYFNRKEVKRIDCPYPCNPTCYNMDFSRGL